MKRRCADCASYEPPQRPGGSGWCHFLPPAAFPIRLLEPPPTHTEPALSLIPGVGKVTVKPPAQPEKFAGYGSAFPVVQADAWCSQFAPKESA